MDRWQSKTCERCVTAEGFWRTKTSKRSEITIILENGMCGWHKRRHDKWFLRSHTHNLWLDTVQGHHEKIILNTSEIFIITSSSRKPVPLTDWKLQEQPRAIRSLEQVMYEYLIQRFYRLTPELWQFKHFLDNFLFSVTADFKRFLPLILNLPENFVF